MSQSLEIGAVPACAGQPMQYEHVMDIPRRSFNHRRRATEGRPGEVVMFIRRTDGNFLLHTKDFYPEGVLRVPTGGIRPGETVCDAVYREVREETGLQVEIECFVGVLVYVFRSQGQELRWPSYLFVLRETGGQLKPQDPDEHISQFATVAPEDLDEVADRLDHLPAGWEEWGRFRAVPHRLVAELLHTAGKQG